MQRILAACGFFCNAAEEAAFLGAVNRSFHCSNAYRHVDAPVVPRVSRRNRNLACIQIDVLIPRNLLYLDLSGGHLDPEARLSRHFYADPDVVSFAQIARDGNGFVLPISFAPEADALGGVPVARRARNMNRGLIRAHNLKTRGS